MQFREAVTRASQDSHSANKKSARPSTQSQEHQAHSVRPSVLVCPSAFEGQPELLSRPPPPPYRQRSPAPAGGYPSPPNDPEAMFARHFVCQPLDEVVLACACPKTKCFSRASYLLQLPKPRHRLHWLSLDIFWTRKTAQ